VIWSGCEASSRAKGLAAGPASFTLGGGDARVVPQDVVATVDQCDRDKTQKSGQKQIWDFFVIESETVVQTLIYFSLEQNQPDL